MSNRNAELLSFYFGTVESEERLRIERTLLEEPDALVDYFDLKRDLEKAQALAGEPSPRVWNALARKIRKAPRRTWIAVSITAAAAVLVFALLALKPAFHTGHTAPASLSAPPPESGILLEGREPSSGSSVL